MPKSQKSLLDNEKDIGIVLSYGKNYYSDDIKTLETEISTIFDQINLKLGTKEVET